MINLCVFFTLPLFGFIICDTLTTCPDRRLNMCRCTQNIHASKYVVDCSNTGLTFVPRGIPAYTTHLYLDYNKLKKLKNDSLPEYNNKLKFLSIKHNQLTKLEARVFQNMPSIQELKLYNNSLELKNSLPMTVFQPLEKSLKVLDIRMNLLNKDLYSLNYPTSIGQLFNLEQLKMDCLRDKPLPLEYNNLRKLNTLTFEGGRQNVKSLRNNMFDTVTELNISRINLAGLNLRTIGKHTLSQLPMVRNIDLSNNPNLGIHLTDIASSLKKTAIRVLNLNNVGIVNPLHSVTYILKKFCGLPLEELTLENNYLHSEDIEPLFSTCFPKLQILSLSENYIYADMNLIQDIMKLQHLIGFNISYQMTLSDYVSSGKYVTPYLFERKHAWSPTKIINHRIKREIISHTGKASPFVVPRKLEWIDMCHNKFLVSNVPELVMMQNTSLKYINASYSGVETIVYPMYCPWNIVLQIESFDFRNNNLHCINASVFNKTVSACNWKSLKYLFLGSNKLGNIDNNVCNDDKNNVFGFLEPLTNLRVLDLSDNQIISDDKLTSLQTFTNLEKLDLSSNGIHNFSLNSNNMTKLIRLNLANNNLPCLSQSTTIQLNKLQNATHRLEIDMLGNLLSCNCDCYHFFKWMAVTDTKFINRRDYQCEFDDRKRINLNRLSYIIAKLESHCYGSQWFQMYVEIGVSVNLFSLFCCLMYRMRHHLWYLYMKARLNRRKLKALTGREKYTYSAFVSCEQRDLMFVIRKLLPILETEETRLKFCVAQRNFLVGTTIMDNIMKSMDGSRKIIFIISQYFLRSGWCKEELRIAHQVCYIFHCITIFMLQLSYFPITV